MRRAITAAIPFLLAAVVAQAAMCRPAAAAEPEPQAPVTPFIDSGNTLPDLAARERHPSSDKTLSVRGPWYGWQILLGDIATTTCAFALQNGGWRTGRRRSDSRLRSASCSRSMPRFLAPACWSDRAT